MWQGIELATGIDMEAGLTTGDDVEMLEKNPKKKVGGLFTRACGA